MPASLRVAIATALLVAAIGAASSAVWIVDAAAAGAATRWLSAALHLSEGIQRAGSPLFLAAFAVVPIVLRRDATQARVAMQLSLLATITLGVMASGLTGSAVAARRPDAEPAAMLVVIALLAVLAGALSRPSARAWLAGPSAGAAGAGRARAR